MAQHTHARPQRQRRHQPRHGPEELTALLGGGEPHPLPWHPKHEGEPTAIDALACWVEHEERLLMRDTIRRNQRQSEVISSPAG